jgi:hypothetical protein
MSSSGLPLKNSSQAGLLAAAALAVLLLSACAGLPPAAAELQASAWVAVGSPVVLRVEPDALEVLATLTGDVEKLKPLLERTRTLWVGLPNPANSDGKSMVAAARVAVEGDFPRVGTAWILFWNRPPQPWTVRQARKGLLLAQQGPGDLDQLPSFDQRTLPPGDLVLTFDAPGKALLGPALERLFSPVRLLAVLDVQPETLEGTLQFDMGDQRTAGAALILLKLAGGLLDARLEQDLVWRAEGRVLIGSPLRIPRENLSGWLSQVFTEAP